MFKKGDCEVEMKLINVGKSYGSNVVFEGFSFEAENGITAILGPSGCGKTTLLNIVAGLTTYTGSAELPEKTSYLFQNQRLIPNLTVLENLYYVLHEIKDKQRKKEIADSVLEIMELTDCVNLYPSQLSGGMGQRVAIARAFEYDAPVLLMDEPFKGLDISLKKRIIQSFVKMYSVKPKTVLFVTHDIEEAILLSDRIVVLQSGGRIVFDEVLDIPREMRTLGSYSAMRDELYKIL